MKAKRSSLKQQMLISHLSLAAIGVLLLLVAFFTTLWLRSSTHKLALISQPRMEALDHIDRGVYQSATILLNYITLPSQESRVLRNQVWKEFVYPSYKNLKDLTTQDETEINRHLDQLIDLLAELHSIQAQIESLAHTPEEQPARLLYNQSGMPLYRDLSEAAERLTRTGGGGFKKSIRRLGEDLEKINLRVLSYLDEGGEAQVLDEDFAQVNQLLAEAQKEASPLMAPALSGFNAGLLRYQSVCHEVFQARQAPDWNRSLYLQSTQMMPLQARVTQAILELDEILGGEIAGDANQATLIATVSMGVNLLLVLIMIISALWFSAKKSAAITRPIHHLAHASHAFAAGDLGQDIPVETNDELGDLTITFNRMKNSLVESYGRHLAIVDSAVDGIITFNHRGLIQSFNRAAEDIFGYTEEEALGINISNLLPGTEEALESLDKYMEQVIKSKVGKGQEVSVLHKDQGLHPAYISISETLYRSETIYTGLIRDITEQKKMEAKLIRAKEEAQVANRLKSSFLANISHEIRTPMNGILGMTELALETNLNQNQRRYIKAANGGAKSLLKLLNDILDLSKMEGDHLTLEVIGFDLEQLLEECMETLSLDAQKKGLDFILKIEPQVPAFVMGDPTRLRQILVNLIGNAIKFTETGSVVIQLSQKERSEQEITLAFSVKDTGIGIPADRIDKIFESFTQTDDSTTRKYGGTGLGTTIAKQLVELMGGKIRVDSTLGQGTTFYFNLILKLPKNQPDERSKTLQGLPLKQVLVIDDNPTNLENFQSILTSWGLNPRLAQGPKEALYQIERAKARPFELIIMDVQMPDIDGITLARQIKENLAYKKTPIVFLFSFFTPQYQKALIELGEPLFLFKPVKREELKERIMDAARRLGLIQSEEPVTLADSKTLSFGRSAKVLVVDDDSTNRLLLETRLKEKMIQVSLAVSGEEALERVNNRSYDLILLDLQLPGLNGFETALALRRFEEEQHLKRTPILAISGTDQELARGAVFESGMDGLVAKPVDFNRLFPLISNLLGQLPEVQAKPSERETDLGSIEVPGIELAKGLCRWGDSQRAYLDALKDFRRQNLETAKALEQLIDSVEFSKIAALGHKIRGTAGNISAEGLAKTAEELENRAKELDHEGILLAGPACLLSLKEVLDSIEKLSKTLEQFQPVSAPTGEIYLEEARAKMVELEPAIGRGEAIHAERLAQELERLLGPHPSAFVAKEMFEQIDNFDFEAALKSLKIIQTSLD